MTILLSNEPSALGDAEQSGATGPERTLDQVLASIAELAPLVARHGGEIERERRLPPGLLGALKSARIYGMLVPRRYGGLGLDAPGALRAVSALARLDGSVGWNAMIGQVGSLIPFLATRELCDGVFGDGRDHIVAGSGQPTGTAERVPGGWMVTGDVAVRQWLPGRRVDRGHLRDDGREAHPSLLRHGPGPMTRLPASCRPTAGQIHDTWHTLRPPGHRQPSCRAAGRVRPGPQRSATSRSGRRSRLIRSSAWFPELLMLSHAAARGRHRRGRVCGPHGVGGIGRHAAAHGRAAPGRPSASARAWGGLGRNSWRRVRCSTCRPTAAGGTRSAARRGTWTRVAEAQQAATSGSALGLRPCRRRLLRVRREPGRL